jgi:hypothetical protein
LERANRARTEAFEARAEAKISIYQGILTPTDIILEAATEDGHALMNIRLVQLLISQPGWGMKRATEAILRICEVLEITVQKPTTLTVSWLLDQKSGGRRFRAWVDVIEIRTGKVQPPWVGYPFAPAPRK